MLAGTVPSQAAWRTQAACAGLVSRADDWWAPEDDLKPDERGFKLHLARRICRDCPVRTACAVEAIELLPKLGDEATMRGGLTPQELRDLARDLGKVDRKQAQCGTRSAYVAGCRCDDCRRAHRVYEHQRRFRAQLTNRSPRPLTPYAAVARRVTNHPRTARAISRATGIKCRRVRAFLADMVAAGSVVVHSVDGDAPTYVRPPRQGMSC